MEKLPMCRICLAENVPMYVVVNKNLHELYKKLTDIPFVTEDSRPILACSICCAKLKQCCRLMMKCLEAEELFAKMTYEDYELNPFVKQDHSEFFGGLVKTSIESISIVDVGLTECVIVKEELPAVCERADDIIEPEQGHQRDDIKQENRDIDYSGEEHISFPSIRCEKDSEDDVPLMEFKTEVEEEQEVPKEKQRAVETNRSTVAEEPKLHLRSKLSKKSDFTKHARTHTGEKLYNCDICQCSFSTKAHLTGHISIHTGEKPYKCDICQRSFRQNNSLTTHIRTHTGEKPHKCDICQRSFSQRVHLTNHMRTHTGEKPYKCDICQCRYSLKTTLKIHIRTHTGDKPYKCYVCQTSFSHKVSLTKHIRTH